MNYQEALEYCEFLLLKEIKSRNIYFDRSEIFEKDFTRKQWDSLYVARERLVTAHENIMKDDVKSIEIATQLIVRERGRINALKASPLVDYDNDEEDDLNRKAMRHFVSEGGSMTYSKRQAIIHGSCEKCRDSSSTAECGDDCYLARTQSRICKECGTACFLQSWIEDGLHECHGCSADIRF